ncbi:peptidylprolyl isomerase [Pseudaestuariivita sp.]|uniref:peptidylprolyl isomerase n=1 Tax=Pseudaestuariivita sp. TaxID=2211669 RepID=UPI004057F17D
MRHPQTFAPLRFIETVVAALLVLLLAGAALAQNAFSTAIQVNDSAITFYDLQQRERFVTLLRAPGNPADVARQQLIDDRLRLQAARNAGVRPSNQDILDGMSEFAGRANLTREEFVAALEGSGVDPQTFRDFVEAGLSWRILVQQRFGNRSRPSDGEIDRALNRSGGQSNIRVLISEIIIPAPPREAARVNAIAQQVSASTSEAEFSRYARRFSATPSRRAGGKLPWQNLSDLPPALQPIILSLSRGEVTDPLPIPNAVALFQLRGIEEGPYSAPSYAAIEYAAFYLPGGRTEATIQEARRISRRIDNCDDLYGVARGLPEDRLERVSRTPDQIPTDIAFELSKLDPGETSYTLTRSDGQALMLLMLCGRSATLPELDEGVEDTSRDEIALGLRNRRLATLADSYLEQLRAEARIRE